MELIIQQPDDWHLHIRTGSLMTTVVNHTALLFGRAIIMPNLTPPITSVDQAKSYYQSIKSALPADSHFEPLMTLYLTESMSPKQLQSIKDNPQIKAIKYYPAGATTNSESGVRSLEKVYPLIAEMEKLDIPLLIHGEVVDQTVDIFDREKQFIDRHLLKLHKQFPALRIVFEHITTRNAVEFVKSTGPVIAATITPQHLLMNRNALFQGGIRPHHYCLPVLKHEKHRTALLEAACSGDSQFFLGTDSAPHLQKTKESACGCAGIYSAPIALALYAEAFESQNALAKLEQFASINGAEFYKLAVNKRKLRLFKLESQVEEAYKIGSEKLIPLRAGQSIAWQAELISD